MKKKAICPKCGDTLSHIDKEEMEIKESDVFDQFGVVFVCPKCRAVLGAGVYLEERLEALQSAIADLQTGSAPKRKKG